MQEFARPYKNEANFALILNLAFPKELIVEEPCKPGQTEICHRFQAVECIGYREGYEIQRLAGWHMVDLNLHIFSWFILDLCKY